MPSASLVGLERWGYPSLAGPLLRDWARRDRGLDGVGIELLDLPYALDADAAAARILEGGPSLVGFSCFLWNVEKALEVARRLKARAPGVRVVLGGPELSSTAEAVLAAHPEADWAAVGEGEETFRLLLRHAFLGEGRVADVPGLARREGGAVARSADAPLIDLASAPPVYADGGVVPGDCALLETSRGCPFLCSFCDWGPRKMRYHPLERVEAELAALVERAKYVFLCDADILMDPERGLAILRAFARLAAGKPCTLHFESDPAFLGPEAVALIAADPGRYQVGFGLQSVNEETLRAIHRVPRVEKAGKALAALRAAAPTAQFGLSCIYGLPGEDLAGFRRTLDWALRYRPDCFCANQMLVIPGADVNADLRTYGVRAQPLPPYQILETAALPPERLRQARRLAFEAGVLMAFKPCAELLAPLLDACGEAEGGRVALVEAWAARLAAAGVDLAFGEPVDETDHLRVDERVAASAARLREDRLATAAALQATRRFVAERAPQEAAA